MEGFSEQASTKPLFAAAAAGTFPSASAAIPSSSLRVKEDGDIKDGDIEETNQLESLQLDLAPSTIDAILAAQTIKREESSEEHLTEHSSVKKTDISSSEDEEVVLIDEKSRKRKKKKKEKKERHRSSKKKKHRTKRDHSRSPSPKRSIIDTSKIAKDKVFLDDIPNLSPEAAFRVDRKSNSDLLHYKSVSKFHIAKYKTFCRNCLGDERVSLGPSYSHDKADKKRKKKSTEARYFGKNYRSQSWRKGLVCPQTAEASMTTSSTANFISFPKAKGNANESNSFGNYSCLDKATSLYVQGKGLQDIKNAQEEDGFVMDEIFERTGKMNQQTREDPANVELWLKFVNFQDEVARMHRGLKYTPTSLRDVFQPPRSVIDKKLAILERAIELNPSSLELKKVQLELYQDIWESEKVEKAWEDLLFVHASNVDLWRHYLLRQQARLSTFSFTRVVKKYHRCFQTLIPISEGQVKVINKFEHLEDKLIELCYQYCTFLHQCGYTERGVSIFQALIEFNLFCPPSLNLDTSTKRKARFEAFWESSTPKFGDPKAMGWAKWEEKKESTLTAPSTSLDSTDALEDSILQEKLPRFQTWLKMENCRQAAHFLPWKPDEAKGEQEENCEDPDRLVLFDDISAPLFKVSKSESCVKIVCLFLSFLGLRSAYLKRIIQDMSNSIFNQSTFDKMHQIPDFLSASLDLTVDLKWTPHDSLIVFIRQVIEQSESYFSASTRALFTLLRLDFELKKTGAIYTHELSKTDSKEIKKYGKNLLKESQNRNNLIIWDSFIRLSWAVSDKMEETASMVDVALGMFLDSSALTDPNRAVGILLLCRTFSQIMLNFEPLEHIKMKGRRTSPGSEDKIQVMGCLGALVDGSKFKPHQKVDMSSARVLKVRKRYAAILQQYVADSADCSPMYIHDKFVVLVECSALFEYCASGFQSAGEIFTKAEILLKDKISLAGEKKSCFSLQELYTAHICFIMNVMGIDSLPLSFLRKVLGDALQEFSAEFYFYYIFMEIESGTHIAGRMRKFYEKHLKRAGNISTTLFAVLSEMKRHQFVMKSIDHENVMQSGISESGLLHRIRSLCEHCLHPQVGGHCPLLWRLALRFEASYGDLNRAKGILYRALQNCPWSKSIYIDGVALFGDAELQEMNDLMAEKEIRVRIPLEEIDLLMTAEKESDDGSDANDDADGKLADAGDTSCDER